MTVAVSVVVARLHARRGLGKRETRALDLVQLLLEASDRLLCLCLCALRLDQALLLRLDDFHLLVEQSLLLLQLFSQLLNFERLTLI